MFGRNKKAKATKVATLEEINELAATGKPVLIDFWQTGCAPCRTMSGIIDELAAEFEDEVHVAKVNVREVDGAAETFKVMSTPTFVVMAVSKKAKKRSQKTQAAAAVTRPTQRWRASGLVQKDALRKVLISNGATPSN